MPVRRGSRVLTVVGVLTGALLAVSGPSAAADPAAAVSSSPADVPGGTYVRVDPVRVLDTRVGLGAATGTTTRTTLTVAGRGGVPASGVAAVVLNVTVTGPVDAGWLAVSPTGTSATSNVNYARGQDVAQLVTSKLDDAGRVVLTSSVRTHVVADVLGWFTDSAHAAQGATYSPVTPRRLFDTREAGAGGPMVGGVSRRVPLTGVPAGATAVVVNLTAVRPTADVYVAAWGAGAFPGTSSMNLAAGDVRSNRAIVPLAPDGSITALVNLGHADLVVDLSGWFTADDTGSRFVPLEPARIADTRTDDGRENLYLNGWFALVGTLRVAGVRLTASSDTLPPADALIRPTAAWLSVTVVAPQWRGWLALGPTRGLPEDPQTSPGTSDVNFAPGVTPNAVLAGLGDGGMTSTTALTVGVDADPRIPPPLPDLVVDVAGVFVRTPQPTAGLFEQGNPEFGFGNWDRTWNHTVPGVAGDVVELASGIARLRDGSAVAWDRGEPQVLATDARSVASSPGGVYVVRRDGTVWTDDVRPGMRGVPGSSTDFGPVEGLTDVRAVSFGGRYGQAVHEDGTVSAWGGTAGTAGPVTGFPGPVTALVASPTAGYRTCAALADGSVLTRFAVGDPVQTLPDVRAVSLVASPDTGCYALDDTGRVHHLTAVDGRATDTVLAGVTATALAAPAGSLAVRDGFAGLSVPDVRVLTTAGTVVDRVVDGGGNASWVPVEGLTGATVIGGGSRLVTWIPPGR